jgi:hypothetical protein
MADVNDMFENILGAGALETGTRTAAPSTDLGSNTAHTTSNTSTSTAQSAPDDFDKLLDSVLQSGSSHVEASEAATARLRDSENTHTQTNTHKVMDHEDFLSWLQQDDEGKGAEAEVKKVLA